MINVFGNITEEFSNTYFQFHNYICIIGGFSGVRRLRLFPFPPTPYNISGIRALRGGRVKKVEDTHYTAYS